MSGRDQVKTHTLLNLEALKKFRSLFLPFSALNSSVQAHMYTPPRQLESSYAKAPRSSRLSRLQSAVDPFVAVGATLGPVSNRYVNLSKFSSEIMSSKLELPESCFFLSYIYIYDV